MTDRELLELAAKAAGLAGYKYCVPWRAMAQINSLGEFFGESWNPLTDDGDALRLAVKLRMFVSPWGRGAISVVARENQTFCMESHYGDDPERATRRAIVQAAAEIGKAM